MNTRRGGEGGGGGEEHTLPMSLYCSFCNDTKDPWISVNLKLLKVKHEVLCIICTDSEFAGKLQAFKKASSLLGLSIQAQLWLQRTGFRACIPRPIRLEAFLKILELHSTI